MNNDGLPALQKIPEVTPASATLATFATVSEFPARSVATVASVAGAGRNSDIEAVAPVAAVAIHPTKNGIWDAAERREMYEERAAIIEYDAGLSRAEAEAAAWADVFGGRPRMKIDD